jgi:hypothetical protein
MLDADANADADADVADGTDCIPHACRCMIAWPKGGKEECSAGVCGW